MSVRPALLALARARSAQRLISRATPAGPSQQTRGILTRRATSFWAPSYPPPDEEHKIADTAMPPLPGPGGGLIAETPDDATPKSRRRDRYLDSLMDKAGHMYLKCELPPTSGTTKPGRTAALRDSSLRPFAPSHRRFGAESTRTCLTHGARSLPARSY